MKHCLSLLLLILSAGCTRPAASERGAADDAPRDTVKSNDPVRLEIVDYPGVMARVQSHRGKVVVMDGWSTSCEPCIKEFPHLVELAKKHANDVACISLSFDYEGLGKPEEQREKVLDFLRAQRATFENLLSSEASDDLYARFELPSIPAVFVYGRDGQLAQRFDSGSENGRGFTYRDVEAKVTELLNKHPTASGKR